MRKPQVTVIGASDDTLHINEAYEIGRYIGISGFTLISGGRGGIMEAVSHGAKDAGGTVVGILPGDSFSQANEHCTIVIPTGIGFARNSMNVLSADIIIVIGGKSGTLSELAYAWQYGIPVIACAFAQGWSQKIIHEPIDERKGCRIFPAHNVEEVCSFLKDFFQN